MWNDPVDTLIRLALAEDIGTGDRTTLATVRASSQGEAVVTAKQGLVLAGMPFFERVFEILDDRVEVSPIKDEGEAVDRGLAVARMRGPLRSILTGERTALNILQRLSGVATLTRQYVDAVEGTGARVCDTRKTTPGMRVMDKHAVAVAGGANHRFGLDSGILIKENHIRACGSITEAVRHAREGSPHLLRVEVEVTDLEELGDAIRAEADAVLLDNMDDDTTKQAVETVRRSGRRITIEASGNLTLERVRRVAELGVHLLSVGTLTHSAPAADLSLEVVG
ncbi:MAG: carboxylating nicotinate-nucleotide diphosphorylase [Myxococcota bacterium]